MCQAGSTAPGELSTQCFPGAVQPHPGVTGCDACLRREVADAEAIEVHPADRRSVLRFEGFDQRQDALADHRLQLTVGSVRIFRFGSEPIERTPLSTLPAVVIGDSISKDAVEPGSSRGRAPEGRSVVEAPDERFLEDVFRFVPGSHPPLQERQKARMVVHQDLQHLGRSGVALGHLSGSRARAII